MYRDQIFVDPYKSLSKFLKLKFSSHDVTPINYNTFKIGKHFYCKYSNVDLLNLDIFLIFKFCLLDLVYIIIEILVAKDYKTAVLHPELFID